MITRVRFQNFKALRDVGTSLGRLTVFVGPNASGKTSILEGIHYVARSTCNDPSSIFTGPRAPELLYRIGGNDFLRFECSADVAQFKLEVWADCDLAQANRQELLNNGWEFKSPARGSEWAYRRLARCQAFGEGKWKSLDSVNEETRQLLVDCGSSVLLRLDASRLAAPSYIPGDVPRVEFGGEGLATTLLYLKANRDDEFAQLVSELCEMVPTVRKIRFAKAKVYRDEVEYLERDGQRTAVPTKREYNGDALEFDTASGNNIPAHLMSEGTLLLLGLLTVLHSPAQPKIVLIDDLDRALHPKAQRSLIELLHKWLDARSDLQIAATTHSPYLLDALKPQEVRLTTLIDDGDVVCAPLAQHPDFSKWSREMNAGEFWSAVGEDWVREQMQAGAAT